MVWATDIAVAGAPAPEPRHHARPRATRARPTTASWRGSGPSAEFVTGGDTHVMTPLPRTVYGPADWEDASLDDWLEK